MTLPDLTMLLELCEADARCQGLLAWGPALRDYPAPGVELQLLLVADDLEIMSAAEPLTDRIESPIAGEPTIHLTSISSAQFAFGCTAAAECTFFLTLGEGLVLYDPQGTLSILREQALEWTPYRLQQGLLLRTGELIQAVGAIERALEAESLANALAATVEALASLRRLEFLAAQIHPGSSFWGTELEHSLAAPQFFALQDDPAIGWEELGGLAEQLAVAADDALDESFGAFEEVLADHPEGLRLDRFGLHPQFENSPHYDLLIWRHHRRGTLVVTAEQEAIRELPGHFTTVVRVQLPEAAG